MRATSSARSFWTFFGCPATESEKAIFCLTVMCG